MKRPAGPPSTPPILPQPRAEEGASRATAATAAPVASGAMSAPGQEIAVDQVLGLPDPAPGVALLAPRVGFGFDRVAGPTGPLSVSVRPIASDPFHVLLAFDCPDRAARGTVLVVPPVSGVVPAIMRALVAALLPDFRVVLPDWVNPRHVPQAAGRFGFAGNVATILAALGRLGPGVGVVGLCQSGPPVLAATALLEAGEGNGTGNGAPAAVALLGAPLDPAAAPTDISTGLERAPEAWLELLSAAPVAPGFPGAGRPVYPAALQYASFAGRALWRQFAPTGGGRGGGLGMFLPFGPFSRLLTDLDGALFRDNARIVFRRRELATGGLAVCGGVAEPRAIRRAALLAVAGTADSVVAPGQTLALATLCPEARQRRMLLEGVDHMGLFQGPTLATAVMPGLAGFLRRHLG